MTSSTSKHEPNDLEEMGRLTPLILSTQTRVRKELQATLAWRTMSKQRFSYSLFAGGLTAPTVMSRTGWTPDIRNFKLPNFIMRFPSTPKTHSRLLSLPQELLDMILSHVYATVRADTYRTVPLDTKSSYSLEDASKDTASIALTCRTFGVALKGMPVDADTLYHYLAQGIGNYRYCGGWPQVPLHSLSFLASTLQHQYREKACERRPP